MMDMMMFWFSFIMFNAIHLINAANNDADDNHLVEIAAETKSSLWHPPPPPPASSHHDCQSKQDGKIILAVQTERQLKLQQINQPPKLPANSIPEIVIKSNDNELKLNVHNGGGTGKNKQKKEKLAMTKRHQTLDRPPKSPQTKKIIIKRSHSLDKRPVDQDDQNHEIDDSNEKDMDIDHDDDDSGGNIFKRLFGKKKKKETPTTTTSGNGEQPELQWEYKTGDINAENVVDIGKSKGVGLMKIGSKISPSETNILRIETQSYSVKDREGNVSGNFIIEQKTGDFDLRPSGDGSGGDGGKWPKMIESGDINARKHGELFFLMICFFKCLTISEFFLFSFF